MEEQLINPVLSLVFAALGVAGSLAISALKRLAPKFRRWFDGMADDADRQSVTLWIGIGVVLLGTAAGLVTVWLRGEAPTDPRDWALLILRTASQFVTNLTGYMTGNSATFAQTKHLFASTPAPVQLSSPVVKKVDYERPAIERRDWRGILPGTGVAVASGQADALRYTPGDGMVSFTEGDDTLRGGGAL